MTERSIVDVRGMASKLLSKSRQVRFHAKNDRFSVKSHGFPTENDGVSTENDGFSTENEQAQKNVAQSYGQGGGFDLDNIGPPEGMQCFIKHAGFFIKHAGFCI